MSSARQQRLWLLERLGSLPEALQLSVAASLPRRAPAPPLVAAFEHAVARHPMVRARFSGEDQVAMQLSGELPILEVVEAGQSNVGDAVQSWIVAQRLRMQDGNLLRGALVQAASESALIVCAHRAIADNYSLEKLLSEVVEPGSARAPEGRELVESFLVEPVPEFEQRALAAVRRMCSELTEPAELTGDRSRPVVQDQRARSSTFALETRVVDAAQELSEALGVRLESVFLAAFSLLIGRYTRRRELLLGRHVVSDRAERPFGPFDNEVVFRARLGELHQLSAQSLIEATEFELSSGQELESVPFESLLEKLALPRDASRAPVFQIAFGFATRPVLSGGWTPLCLARTGSAMDLAVNVISSEANGHGLDVSFVVTESEGLFSDPERARRLASHLEVLLLKMADDPSRPIDALPLVSEQERKLLTHGVNPGAVFLSEDTIADRVERAGKAHPDALAVVCGDERLSYRELELQATRLSRKLRELGVGRNDRVAVCLERSPRLIVALYAVLKAGAAYVPVEPAQPRERAEFVLEDAEPTVVLVEGDTLRGCAVPRLELDAIQAELQFESARPLEPMPAPGAESSADALAYVIYTSGSTGRPKGCLVSNRNVIRLFDATQDWFAFSERDVWTMFHSVAFDFSVWEIWGALLYGGRLVVVPYACSRSPDEFRKLVADEGVTILNQTPSAFHQFIEADARSSSGPLSLRTLIFGGEALELESLRPWLQRHGDKRPRLVNMYGITETTVHVSYRPISWADLDSSSASVIGVPIPDMRCYVVDEALNLVPVGVPGELLVAGAGVSGGYFRRPELDAERFLEDAFSLLPGGRSYRSGDLVRRLPNGELDYLGRIDQQVKIRGFRIETAEVEAALRRSGLVRDAHVLAAKKPASDAAHTRRGETVLVAYVVTESTPHELRLSSRSALPEYMVPSVFVPLPAIPMTANGKVDRLALPNPFSLASLDDGEQYIAPRGRFEEVVAQAFAATLGRSRVSAGCHFFDEGGTSLEAVKVAQHIGELLSIEVPVIKLFEHTTVEALARYLEYEQVVVSKRTPQRPSRTKSSADEDAIAIIGMSGRFPGAASVDALWHNLLEGKESISYFASGSLDPSLDPAQVANPDYVPARGVLDDPSGFDAAFFGMPPREAEVTDPQQRLGLELAWEALESGGYDPARFSGAIGVYCGEYNVSYYTEHVLRRPDVVESVGALQAMLGNEKDFIATRIAHKLDLRGPAISIHTACSTSLVAVAQAFYALRTRQCDMALAGGVAITCPPLSGYLYQEGGMLSPDGHTRPFDSEAKGTVFSDGGAFVLLKRLSDAEQDGDTIFAVLRGVATNNDGAGKMSFTAPSAAGQAAVIERALAVAGVDAATIGYVETHGTATPLGDPIEIEALTRAFGRCTDTRGFCGIGSIKSNLGHLVAAAGVTGLIKATLSVQTGVLPPSLHFKRANPKLNLERSPFYVVDRTTSWPAALSPRRAGVSSFGVGGTNAHVIVEERPTDAQSRPARRAAQVLLLSARSERALHDASQRLSEALAAGGDLDLADVAFTLAVGRRAFSQRRFVVAKTPEEALVALRSGKESIKARKRSLLAFAFSGQGSQYLAMGRDLARSEPVFRRALERCIGILRSGVQGPGGSLDCDLGPVLDPAAAERERGEQLLLQTAYTQPALFAVEYALFELWKSLGVVPDLVLGHSIGEIVAACVAGVWSLEDALRIVLFRGRLMQNAPPGVMLSVRAAASAISDELPAELGLAAVNAPQLCVVSGPEPAIASFERRMAAREIATTRLRTSHAFHSPMMDGVIEPFSEIVRGVKASPPKIAIISSVTGRALTSEQAIDPNYWGEHVRRTVRFADALGGVWRDTPDCLVLELGPRATLATLGRQIAEDARRQSSLPSLDVGAKLPGLADPDEQSAFLRAVGGLWSQGVDLDNQAFFAGESRHRIPLPSYPFERQRYWVDAPAHERLSAAAPIVSSIPISQPASPDVAEDSVSPDSGTRSDRRDAILDSVRRVFEEASGVKLAAFDPATTFTEIGLDSLALTQCAQLLSKRLSVSVSFRQLAEDFPSLDSLCVHLAANFPTIVSAAPSRPRATPGLALASSLAEIQASLSSVSGMAAAGDGLAAQPEALHVMTQQLELMERQLSMLQSLLRLGQAAGKSNGNGSPRIEELPAATLDGSLPPVPGARLGRDPQGNPAWFVPSPENPQKYVKLG